MKVHSILALATLSFVLGGFAEASVRPLSAPAPTTPLAAEQAATGWIAKKSDHICGISDPKKVSNPARVKYQECLDATKPMKKLKDEGIDPESAEGKALRARAVRLVAKAAEKVRLDEGYCSIWKKIRHTDGREVPNATQVVIDELEDEGA